MVGLLLEGGADITTDNNNGFNSIHHAVLRWGGRGRGRVGQMNALMTDEQEADLSRQTDRQTDRWINEWRGRMREGGRVVEVGKDEIEAVVGSNMISLCPLPPPPPRGNIGALCQVLPSYG